MRTNPALGSSESSTDGRISSHVVLGAELAWINKRREAAFGEHRTDSGPDDSPRSFERLGEAANGSSPGSSSDQSTQTPGSTTCQGEKDAGQPGGFPQENEADRVGKDHLDADGLLVAQRGEAMEMNLAGLAFSGGGIRAGTFAIGFLQGLSSLALLSRFDYVSTVSGGGYAGGWLAAWIYREGQTPGLDRPVRNVESQLAVSRVAQAHAHRRYLNDLDGSDGHSRKSLVVDEEPEPIRHLREYSSYMAPRMGLFTADTWAILMTWSRNVGINMMMLFPAAMLLVLAARGVVYAYANVDLALISSGPYGIWYRGAAFLALLAGMGFLARGFWANARALQEFRRRKPSTAQHDTPFERPAWEPRIFATVIGPVLIAALLITCTALPLLNYLGMAVQDLAMSGAGSGSSFWISVKIWIKEHLQFIGLPNILLHVLVFGLLMVIGALLAGEAARSTRWKFLKAAFVAGASGGVLFAVAEYFLAAWGDGRRPDLLATFAVPSVLLVLIASVVVEVALLGPSMEESEREWWARLCAGFGISAIAWIVTIGTVVYAPAALLVAGPLVRSAIASGWLLTTAAGMLSGRLGSASTRRSKSALPLIAAIAPPVFVIGFVGLVATLVAYLVQGRAPAPVAGEMLDAARIWGSYLTGVQNTSWLSLASYSVLMFILYDRAANLIDVNLFSLNSMYANRLVRCYLGATRPKAEWELRWGQHQRDVLCGAPTMVRQVPRNPNPVTGFDPNDDIPLSDLCPAHDDIPLTYRGPFPLINATLNRVAGKELAWRDRKGESFFLSPLYCGAEETGYSRCPQGTDAKNLTLGRAMSISGAAIDPNMGYLQSPALTAFLTILNARLGYWMERPGKRNWKASGPTLGGGMLLRELFGHTDAKGDFVHLSDGGHFENLGVYELIRRRCRFIVALDSGEDGNPSSDNLATLVRLCRIDFGVRIQIDTDPLRMSGEGRLTSTHVVIGRVRYDDVDSGEKEGVLVYVKISMTGDEPADLLHYASQNPGFPHEATDFRQSFDEEQFEAYRALGDHIARRVFEGALQRSMVIPLWKEPDADREFHRGNVRLFTAVAREWSVPPASQNADYVQATRDWVSLQRDLLKNESLAPLAHELYPEFVPAPGSMDEKAKYRADRAAFHAVGMMTEIMENAWFALNLKSYVDLPMNQGWLNSFRRWTTTRTFRRYWATYRSEFSPDFVQFLERSLHLGVAQPRAATPSELENLGFPLQPAVDRLAEEFTREWPDELPLKQRIELARDPNIGLKSTPFWCIVQSPTGPQDATHSQDAFICGVILVTETKPQSGRLELFVWIRPPHRSIGLGSRMVPPKIEEVAMQLSGRELIVRYPRSKQNQQVDLEHATWRRFFVTYGFAEMVEDVTDATVLKYSRKAETLT